jgi:hypothetical protein
MRFVKRSRLFHVTYAIPSYDFFASWCLVRVCTCAFGKRILSILGMNCIRSLGDKVSNLTVSIGRCERGQSESRSTLYSVFHKSLR